MLELATTEMCTKFENSRLTHYKDMRVTLVLLDRDWGVEADPSPSQKFSVTSVGVFFNQWGVKPPQPL